MKKIVCILFLFLFLACEKKESFIEEENQESRSDSENDGEPGGWRPPSISVDSTITIIQDTLWVYR